MMKIIGVLNQKGGVAKTTTAGAIGYYLAKHGYKTLLVDTDAQANLSMLNNIDVESDNKGFYDVMMSLCGINNAILPTNYEKLDILAGSPMLATLDMRMSNTFRRELVFSDALSQLKGYDFVVVDTPPALGLTTLNVLMAVDGVVIPSEADMFSLKGITCLHDTIAQVRRYRRLDIYGILLTRVERTSNDRVIADDTARRLAELFKTRVFETRIRAQKFVKESRVRLMNVIEYSEANRRKGTKDVGTDYEEFVEELLKILEESYGN